ncbi:hypothetical protein Snoj_51330 [Streptomyces nojiriensis]|uniref:Uncharacterized protein n=1 Tax=Streptomyces nojiriensis TaxID=66374 RepID=A0ABQ3SSV6_9ACTN|nr:hypothetical protein GCM10010205_19570 [Streptomyces nojiriensis]GHI71215.1 hypothetical protein Snoj_51330 [Streptomyces nojiriensis]
MPVENGPFPPTELHQPGHHALQGGDRLVGVKDAAYRLLGSYEFFHGRSLSEPVAPERRPSGVLGSGARKVPGKGGDNAPFLRPELAIPRLGKGSVPRGG